MTLLPLTRVAAQMAVPGPAPKSSILPGWKSGRRSRSSSITCTGDKVEVERNVYRTTFKI